MDSAIDKGVIGRDMGFLILQIKGEYPCTDDHQEGKYDKSGNPFSRVVLLLYFLFH
jgi:hypothetical protein